MVKTEKLFSKIFMIVFLIMLILGFTIPGFLNSGNNSNPQVSQVEPRLCTTDADCYLICDDKPIASLCFKNLCQQNDCNEYSLYPYQNIPFTFDLKADVDGKNINLQEGYDSKNFYVSFNDDKINIFSNLNLQQILEKGNIIMTDTCLTINQTSYCNDDDKKLKVMVNNNQTLAGSFYRPKEGDMVEIKYENVNGSSILPIEE